MWKLAPILLILLIPLVSNSQEIHSRTEQLEGRTLYLAWRDERTGTEMPALFALHGSGRSAGSYAPDTPESVPFYVHQRELALKAGYLFIALSNGPDTWGTDEGLEAVIAAIQYVKRKFPVREKWVFWASSAGGVLLGRILNEYPDLVDRALGTFPVYDLSDSFTRLGSARAAYPDPDLIRRINPANTPQAFARVPYLVFHGTDDVAVPVDLHSDRMVKEVNALGGKVRLIKVAGGHSTDNRALYNDEIILDFLK